MTVGDWVQGHRRSILFLVAALAAVGIYAALKLPVALFPTVDFPRVAVNLDAGDRPAEQMELQVTRPVEDAVRRVPGIEEVRSTTSRGAAEISLNFGWGMDMATATLQVNAAIGQILSTLPPGTSVSTRRMDPSVFPIIAYSLTSSTLQLSELYDIAEYALRPLLSSVTGVGRVQTVGGAVAEIRITVDPDQLRAYGLTLDDVAKAMSATNVVSAVGRIEDRYKLYLVVSDTRLQTSAQIRQTVLKNAGNGLVVLGDVADVTAATVPQWIRVTADGQDAVLLNVYQQPGSNSVQIARDVKARLDSYRQQLPRGVSIANWYDQSELVLASAASVRDAILIGVGARRARAVRLPAQLAHDVDRVDRRAGDAGDDHRAVVRARHELQHHDAGRHGRGRRAHHRRCHRHDRAHRAALAAAKPTTQKSVMGAAVAVPAAARRVQRSDDRHFRSAGVPHRRNRRLFQSACRSPWRAGFSSRSYSRRLRCRCWPAVFWPGDTWPMSTKGARACGCGPAMPRC